MVKSATEDDQTGPEAASVAARAHAESAAAGRDVVPRTSPGQ